FYHYAPHSETLDFTKSELSSLSSFLNGNGYSYSHTNHGVVSCSDETHHLYVSRYGGGSCKLSVRMHTSKCIGHTIGSGTSCHVVRMKGTSCTAAGSNGEVYLAFLVAFLLVGTCNGMLETCGVGGVTGDGNVNALFPHDGNAFLNAVRAVAVNLRAESFGVCLAEYFFYFVGVGIVLCLNICKSVDTGNDLCGVFAKSVQDNAERFLTNLV